MEEFFKYQSGYVNIDDENLFLTNSGNWSETKTLLEKNKNSIRKNKARNARMQLYLLIVFGIITCIVLKTLAAGTFSTVVLISMPVAGYKLYQLFQRNLGKRYKIPLSKIDSIEKIDDGYEIKFRNADNENDVEFIAELEEKGVDIIDRVKMHLHNKVYTNS